MDPKKIDKKVNYRQYFHRKTRLENLIADRQRFSFEGSARLRNTKVKDPKLLIASTA